MTDMRMNLNDIKNASLTLNVITIFLNDEDNDDV